MRGPNPNNLNNYKNNYMNRNDLNNLNNIQNNNNNNLINNNNNKPLNNVRDNNINFNSRTIYASKRQLNFNKRINNDLGNDKDNIIKPHREVSKKKNEFKKKKELEKMKKENELEEQIKDHLKCYICLCNITKPKMCLYCKRICCEECINRWLQQHSFCGICKHHLTNDDLIEIPFLDAMSSFFIDNIEKPKKQINFDNDNSYNRIKRNDSQKNKGPIKINNIYKREPRNNNIINNIRNINNFNNINNEDNESNISFKTEINNKNEISEVDIDICMEHGKNIDFYCIQCDKYYCGDCLTFFGKEKNNHNNHFIIRTSQLNDFRIKEVLNEYKKLSETNIKVDNLIGLYNSKIKDYEIKKYEIIKTFNEIKNFYMKLIDEESEDIQQMLQHAHQLKNNFDTNKNNAMNKFANNISKPGSFYKGTKEIITDFQKLNVDPQLEKTIINKTSLNQKNNPKLDLENYQSEFIEYKVPIPPNQNFSYNQELVNCKIPGTNINLKINYSQNKAVISYTTIMKDVMFYAYIIFKVNKYGLEFIHLNDKDYVLIDIKKFLYLCDEDNKITFKFCFTKNSYKE